jgi:hypothetical protein
MRPLLPLACILSVASAALLACGSSASPGFSGASDSADGGAAPPVANGADAASTGSGQEGDFGDASAEAGRCTDVVDVVFVLDVSSSMDFVLDNLDAEISKVVAAANKLGAGGAHFGLVAFADSHKLDLTGPLEGGKVHTAPATLQAAFREYKRTYTNANRNPGDGPTGPTTQNPICEENALDALHAAAADFPWRASATRVVIAVTDDTFLEKPDNYGDRDGDGKTDKTTYPREGDYPARFTLDETISELRARQARVFSFTRLKPPGDFDLFRCGTGRRLPWASVSDGWSTTYMGFVRIPARTDGKNFDLEEVRDGRLELSTTINEVVLRSYCNPPK